MPILREQCSIAKLTAMTLVLFLAACFRENIRGPLSAEESSSVQRGDRAIVLLRFTVEDENGKSLDHPLARRWMYDGRLGVGDFESGGKLKDRDIRILSEDAWNEGWLSLVLPPGYYYFEMGRAIFWYTGGYGKPVPRWRIEVPPGAPVVYAGTFQLSGSVYQPLFEQKQLIEIDQAATQMGDDTKLAAQIARRDLSSLPAPVTRLAVLHTGPILLDMPPRVPASQ